ncbi:DUF397 domain-containing protein [Nocardia sp. NPDC049737]|uniref:DUF397 domain-containing protein n=1 Tax=Nocardia sp. NPDC049737 TaxID=3154358 RepID=UPI0034437805
MVSIHRRDNPRRVRPLTSEGQHMANHSDTKWFKSSHSGAHSNCIEIAFLPNNHVSVRDSKDAPAQHSGSPRPLSQRSPPRLPCGKFAR